MKKYLMLDTETTNDIECPLCYDIGFAVIDEDGTVYETASFVVADVFLDEELMASAYFADKIPQYQADLASGKRVLRRWTTIKFIVRATMEKYGIDTIIAHNMRFDYLSTATTQRYLTSSKWRYFFPYGTKFACTLKMARVVFSKDDNYKAFCEANGFLNCYHKPQLTAEILYRYLTQNIDFVESHTGLEDVLIEKDIFLACKRANPSLDGLLFGE